MDNCLFCRIIRGEIPSTKVFENDLVYAFRDINPQAPSHILVIPKVHIASIDEADKVDDTTLAAIIRAIREIASAEGLNSGYRVVSNCGDDACQSVKHLHFHILGGKKMSETMT